MDRMAAIVVLVFFDNPYSTNTDSLTGSCVICFTNGKRGLIASSEKKFSGSIARAKRTEGANGNHCSGNTAALVIE